MSADVAGYRYTSQVQVKATMTMPMPMPMPSPRPAPVVEQPQVSTLTPREVWSPLVTPTPGSRGDSRPGPRTSRERSTGTGIRRYQLDDPGVIPASSSSSSKPITSRPKSFPVQPTSRPPQPQTPTRVEAPYKPGLGTMIRLRAAASPPSQGEKLASRRPLSDSCLPPIPMTKDTYPRHGRHLSEPTLPESPKTRRHGSFHYSPTEDMSILSPLALVPQTSRKPSTSSTASSGCSSAASLARHRAIRARPTGRVNGPRPMRASLAAPMSGHELGHGHVSAQSHMRTPSSDTAATIGSMSESDESQETGSTVSELSITTTTTVNLVDEVGESLLQPTSASDDDDHFSASYQSPYNSKPISPIVFPGAPYRVPSEGPMTLEWESDASELDETERVWRELEAKLGRRVRGRSVNRGKRVVKSVQHAEDQRLFLDRSTEDDDVRYPGQSTDASLAEEDTQTRPKPEYRLDSHVMTALSALRGFDIPELDCALATTTSDDSVSKAEGSPGRGRDGVDGGLQGGLPLTSHSMNLPTLLPRKPSGVWSNVRSHPTQEGTSSSARARTSALPGKTPDVGAQDEDEDEDEVIVIRDLDTGEMRRVRLDELSLLA